MNMNKIDYKYELYRKLLHLSSLWIIFVIYFLDKKISLVIFLFLSISILLIEVSRNYFSPISKIYKFIFGKILRTYEVKDSFSGAFYIFLASLLVTLLFPKIVAITSLAVMLISDSFAALIGKKFGSHIIYNKSIEGSLAFFLSAILIISFFFDPKIYYFSIVVTAFLATVIELFSSKIKIDDNLTITITTACSLITLT